MMDGPCVGGPYYLLCERVCVTGLVWCVCVCGVGSWGWEGAYTCCASPGELQRTAGRIDLASRPAGAAGTNQATANKSWGPLWRLLRFAPSRKTTGDIMCFPNARCRASPSPGAMVSPLDAVRGSRLNVWLLMRRP